MNDDTDDKKTITRRIAGAAGGIAVDDEPLIEYHHGVFCQIVLPRSLPKGREFVREYQNGVIKIQAGDLWDGQKLVPQPVPYGPKARLTIIHIHSEAVRRQSPEIYCESSGRKFMERLGLNTDGGSSYQLFKQQMKAWAACQLTLGFNSGDGKAVTLHAKPVQRFDGWLEGGNDGDPPVLWPGIITLSAEYFEDLVKHAVPLDARALRALAHSALALDAYSFFARRLHALSKPVKVTWPQFLAQFGQEYTGPEAVKNFKKKWIPACRAALAVYPSAKVEQVRGGLLLHPSYPPIHPASVAVSHGLADQVRRTLPKD